MIDWKNIPNKYIFLAFTFLALALRSLSFFYSVIDADESTYLVIAQEILQGKQYYTDVWDTKPIGIFGIFAATLYVFGKSIWAVRLLATLFLAGTAYFIFRAIERWGYPRKNALIGGLAYLLMGSMHKWNFPANTELFFNFFTALSLFLLLGKGGKPKLFWSGLSLGIGFIIKYFVLFDFIAFALYFGFGIFLKKQPGNWKGLLLNWVLMGLGFVLPFGLVFAYYYFYGPFEAFRFTTFELPGRYPSRFLPLDALNFFLGFALIYLPFVIGFWDTLLHGKDKALRQFGGLWIGLVWIMVLLPGKHFLHYYFQLLIPTAFVLGGLWSSESRFSDAVKKWKKPIFTALLGLFLIWNISFQVRRFVWRTDQQRAVATYLENHMQEDESLYCNSSVIIYFLANRPPMGKYVHASLLTKPDHQAAVGLDPDREFQDVIDKKPNYLVIENTPPKQLEPYLQNQCNVIHTVGEHFAIYKRK
ncbi:MAG: glycosyltransferase family 39 protein [Saprospiraceae bacterium]